MGRKVIAGESSELVILQTPVPTGVDGSGIESS
jgi:hypothetical protein